VGGGDAGDKSVAGAGLGGHVVDAATADEDLAHGRLGSPHPDPGELIARVQIEDYQEQSAPAPPRALAIVGVEVTGLVVDGHSRRRANVVVLPQLLGGGPAPHTW
jgi:hypothetical protein